MANIYNLLCSDIDVLPASTYKYISQNQSTTCSLLEIILSSKKEIVSQVKVQYGESFNDHTLIYCELVFPNCAFAESGNELTEVIFKI